MKEMNTAIFIVNYNMPERTEAIYERLLMTVNHPHDFYVIDNGSDLVKPASCTTVWVEMNKQTIGGFLAGVNAAVASGKDYDAYWFIITSAEFDKSNPDDPLDHLLPALEHPDTFAVHPAVTFNYAAWEQWMCPRNEGLRRIWGMDYIAALISAEKYHQLGGFNPELTMGWGVPGEMNWKARKEGWKLYIQDDYVIHKETDVGYDMHRMMMTAKERRYRAGRQSDTVLAPVYGLNYRERFRYEYTELGADGDY